MERTSSARGPTSGDVDIDLVVTWVDGRDQTRNLKRQRYMASETGYSKDATSACRVRNNDELKYLLRSVSLFTPWIRRVFVVVSDNQRPTWAAQHPKLKFVNDSEIFGDQGLLPTFNSHALECNIHRIEGLAEHYIYLCDDMMFGRPLSPDHFRDPESGAIKVYFHESISHRGTPYKHGKAHNSAWRNNNRLLDQTYGAELRPSPCHLPSILRRSLAEQTEQCFAREFELTSARRFRSNADIHPVGLQQYFSLYSGAARGVSASHCFLRLDRWRPYLRCQFREVLAEKPNMFCVNDADLPEDSPKYDDLHNFLEEYFPQKSEFEL